MSGHRRPPPIPETPGDLTPAWLTGALAASAPDVLGGATVTGVAVAPVGTGQMSDSLRLTLRYDRPTGAPATLVAKLAATDPTSRATARSLGSYENEVRFYQQLAPGLPVRTPRVLHADIDVEAAAFVLLLEDMAPARAGDQLAGCTPEDARVAVDELVRLHAPRWDDPTLRDLPWLHRDRAAGQQFLLSLLPTAWDGFRERHAADLGPDVHAAGVAGYPWDRFWHDYRRSTWAGLVMAVAASMLVERTARGDRMFLTMAARHARHALDLDAPAVIAA